MSSTPTPTSKRRKIRKGTTSCWECKRRKVRCSLVDDPQPVCAACRRRGTKCLTQDNPEGAGDGDGNHNLPPLNERIGWVDAMVDGLTGCATPTPTAAPNTYTFTGTSVTPTPAQTDGGPRGSAAQIVLSPHDQIPYADLSRELHASLPPSEDVNRLREAGAHVSIAFDVAIMRPYSDMENNWSDGTESLLPIPSAASHPVLLAKYMFSIIRVLQHLDFKKSSKQIVGLSDAPQNMSRYLAETAIRLVTTRDELLNNVEGLECVVMEACYHMNRGNWRPVWTAIRRAMAVAQVMGVHRPGVPVRTINPQYKVDRSHIWHRIVYLDRSICLFMGLPQGSLDRSMASERALGLDTPLGRLERLHCAIASRVLERNDSGLDTNPIETLRTIDSEINKAAETMPSGWWMSPTPLDAANNYRDGTNKPPAVVWDMLRLVAQIYHFGLINQLHVPFMLGFTIAAELQTYSQTTCINASREVLSRYISFRAFNRVAFSGRIADFFALTAALLLLVGHIRQHSDSSEFNPLLHQRHGDRAMVKQAIARLQEVSWVTEDKLTAMSAGIVSRLLEIEAEAARGMVYTTQSIQRGEEAPQEGVENVPHGATVLRFCVPYYGKVHILHQGVAPPQEAVTWGEGQGQGETGGLNLPDAVTATRASTTTGQPITSNLPQPSRRPPQPWYSDAQSNIGGQDYTFPGLDLAFFDSLTQEATVSGNANTLQGA
ncbi:hypothetical protein ASPCAL02814 [Aspergillus calidoustus]|uniref:Zn(2)-C6 fungal-type domain-containing protein n=1 Tax=Aspergillus calidoustus TaxID=454130 RepID=A0A0U5GRC6_ASPCI|nr:hypothetical protein ASPCAL02814 [Aspergillus calidoustus]